MSKHSTGQFSELPHDKFIPIEQVAQPLEETEEAQKFYIAMVSDIELSHKDRTVQVKPGNRLGIANVLLSNADKWLSRNSIEDLGHLALTTTSFHGAIRGFMNDLTDLTGEGDVLDTVGRSGGMKYKLSPRFIFRDERAKRGVKGEVPDFEMYDQTWRVSFVSKESRRALMADLFSSYAEVPSVQHNIAKILRRNELEEFAPFELEELFHAIEKGVAAFLHPPESPQRQASCIEAVESYQRLLLSTIPIIRARTERFRYLKGPGEIGDDLFQEALVAVAKTTLDVGKKGEDFGERSLHYYADCAQAIHWAIADVLRGKKMHSAKLTKRQYHYSQQINRCTEMLWQKLQRDPTLPDLIKELPDIPITEVKKHFARHNSPYWSIDQYAMDYSETLLYRFAYFCDDIDEQLDRMEYEDLLSDLFASKALSDREKIALSLYYGVYSRSLAYAEFNRKKSELKLFVYPSDEPTFNEIVQRCGDSYGRIGAELEYDRANVRTTVKNALIKARKIIGPTPPGEIYRSKLRS